VQTQSTVPLTGSSCQQSDRLLRRVTALLGFEGTTEALALVAIERVIEQCRAHVQLSERHRSLAEQFAQLLERGAFMSSAKAVELGGKIIRLERRIEQAERMLIGGETERC
jgi:hypothetical protein